MDVYCASSEVKWLFGSRASSSSNRFCLAVTSSTAIRSDYGATNSNLSVGATIGRYTIDKNRNVTNAQGATLTHAEATFAVGYSALLMTISTAGTAASNVFVGKVYSCRIYSYGTLVRDYVPCTNASGVYGLFDMVGKRFYANAGSGSFTGA